nr:aldehyde dehydrogenase family protein [Hymenobacter volaticus]
MVEKLIEDDRVRAVTLTGSEPAGAQVAAIAGRQIKKTVLELGGSDAFIVLADADLELAAKTAAQARMINAGQSCIAAKRFIVEKPVVKEFISKMKTHLLAFRTGDPLNEDTQYGPSPAQIWLTKSRSKSRTRSSRALRWSYTAAKPSPAPPCFGL